jgi:hypothetical protein
MINYLRQIRFQFVVFLREKIHWLLLVFGLIFLFTSANFWNNDTFSPAYINSISGGIFLFTSIVYGVFATRFFLLEVSDQSQIQWARSRFRTDFISAKFFAMFFGALVLLLPTLVIMLIRGAAFNNLAGLLQGAAVWFYLFVPTFLFVTVLSIVSGLLLRKPALAMILTLLCLIGLVVRQTNVPDLLMYQTFGRYGLLYGYGPIGETLRLNRSYFSCLSIGLLLFALLIGHFILPANKAKLTWTRAGMWFFLVILFSAGTYFLGSRLNDQKKFIVAGPDLETLHKQDEICEALESYELTVTINNRGTIEKGLALVKLKKDVSIREHLLLLPSLKAKPVTVQESSEGIYRIEYEGDFVLPNYSYSMLIQAPEIMSVGFLPGGYIDHSKLLLLSHGQWHPFSKCDLTGLVLTIPETFTVNYSSADSSDTENGMTRFHWEKSLPEVLIIAGADYEEGDLNGQKALLPKWLDLDTRGHYELIQTRFAGLMERVAVETSRKDSVIILPIVGSSILDKNGSFFLRSSPVTMFLPGATPAKKEIEAALEVIQAWWSQGTVDTSLQKCFFIPQSCLRPSRSTPDDRSVMPLLYYFSLKLASEQNPETVNLESIIQLYQTRSTDRSSAFAVPRLFDEEEENKLLVSLFQLDQCVSDGELWNVLAQLREEKSGVWMNYEDLVSAIEQLTGYSLERLEQQCPSN